VSSSREGDGMETRDIYKAMERKGRKRRRMVQGLWMGLDGIESEASGTVGLACPALVPVYHARLTSVRQ
jgi:hypothetical protein